jgi:uncharacterized membrane protein
VRRHEQGKEWLELREDRRATRSLLWTGVILGVGVIGALDEIVLHQLLQWHNFYVHTTQFWRIFSDGVFHLASSALLLFGAFRLWRDRRLLSEVGSARALVAGVFLGMGAFNLYDGTVQHKLLRLHPVREDVANQLPYDVGFIGIAALLLATGWYLWRGVQAETQKSSR